MVTTVSSLVKLPLSEPLRHAGKRPSVTLVIVSAAFDNVIPPCIMITGPPARDVSYNENIKAVDCETSGRRVAAVFVGVLGILMLILVGILLCIIWYYRREVNKYK